MSKTKAAKDWTEEEITRHIDMLEANPCSMEYIRSILFKAGCIYKKQPTQIAINLDTTIASIKTTINGLKAQFGREMSKESTTRSGQRTGRKKT